MQDIVKRYFWVLGAVVVMVCAVFAAKCTNYIAEAKYLGDSPHAPVVKVAMAAPSPMHAVHSKNGTAFAQRNMFCATCTPPVATSIDPSSIVNTSLPLVLLATNVSATAADSYATVVNTQTQQQGSFSIGDPIPGATGKLTQIHYKYIEFQNGGHLEQLALAGANTMPVQHTVTRTVVRGNNLQAQLTNGIHKVGNNSYEIDKSLVDKVLANPMAVARGARVIPAIRNGKPAGFKLYAIRPSSVYAKLGLTNGDTLKSINGFELTSMDKALEVYTKLREATALQVSIIRRGKPMTLNYTIR